MCAWRVCERNRQREMQQMPSYETTISATFRVFAAYCVRCLIDASRSPFSQLAKRNRLEVEATARIVQLGQPTTQTGRRAAHAATLDSTQMCARFVFAYCLCTDLACFYRVACVDSQLICSHLALQTTGFVTCSACPKGSWSHSNGSQGATRCTLCAAGFIAASTGTIDCSPCQEVRAILTRWVVSGVC